MRHRNPLTVVRSTRFACGIVIIALTGCSIPHWPVDGTLTSPFGLRFRGLSPDLHPGVDIAAPTGTPVNAMRGGRVSFAGSQTGYGLTIIIHHGENLRTRYAHLSEILVRVGDDVSSDTPIGRVGATGNATAPHLHFEIIRWGRHEDPVPLLGTRPRR